MDASAIREVCLEPVLADAQITGHDESGVRVEALFTVRDYPADFDAAAGAVNQPGKKTLVRTFHVTVHPDGTMSSAQTGQYVQAANVKYRRFSPSFKWSVTAIYEDSKARLQIYRGGHYEREVDLSAEHGEWCADEFFGWTCWDEQADLFIYQAEQCEPKVSSHVFNPSFGETLPNRRSPGIFVLDLSTGQLVRKHLALDDVIPTQLVYAGGDIYFVGYDVLPKRYGMAYCINRPTQLCSLSADGAVTKYEPAVGTAYYPVLCGAGRMAYFGTYVGGSHFHEFEVFVFDLRTKTSTKLISAEGVRAAGLSGLFPVGNPVGQTGSESFLVSCCEATAKKLVRISLDGTLSAAGDEQSSIRLHQCLEGLTLTSRSSRVQRPLLSLSSRGVSVALTSASTIDAAQEIIHVAPRLDIILTKPEGTDKLIIFPHGGPNYSYVAEFSLLSAVGVACGYAIAAINYTGSAGYGQEAIRMLEGRIGTLDVDECVRAAQHLAARYDKLFLYGGSHGGFLVAHLSCRPELAFRACVAINAVIDLPSMAITSDIIDFPFGQLGLPFDLRHPRPPTADELERMRAASPSSRVHLATTPTLVLVGAGDLRVPPSQGIAWHTWLKARGIPTELYMYPGTGHAIDSAEGECQSFHQTYRFFARFNR